MYKLDKPECQKAKAKQGKVKAESQKGTGYYKPVEFTPLDMPDTQGNLNIMCRRC